MGQELCGRYTMLTKMVSHAVLSVLTRVLQVWPGFSVSPAGSTSFPSSRSLLEMISTLK